MVAVARLTSETQPERSYPLADLLAGKTYILQLDWPSK
jgi:hypothetical protein